MLCLQRRAYKIKEWTGGDDFLDQLARGTGKLGKGGEPDLATAAKMLLYDWQRGKLPFFTLPPDYEHRPPSKAASSAAAAAASPADEAGSADAGAAANGDAEDEPSASSSESEDDVEVRLISPCVLVPSSSFMQMLPDCIYSQSSYLSLACRLQIRAGQLAVWQVAEGQPVGCR